MRISAYAQANFAFNWQGLASSLGTSSGAAKLGAGIGGLSYLASDDKSIGSLATKVGGGAAIGYAGGSLKNAYQARKVVNTPTTSSTALTAPIGNPTSVNTLAAPLPNGKTQSGEAKPYQLENPNPVGATTERMSPKSQRKKAGELAPYEPAGVRRRGTKPPQKKTENEEFMDWLNSSDSKPMKSANTSRNISHFVNFSPYCPKAPR